LTTGAGSSLILGTAQFGLAYGVAGRGEVVPENEVREILELADASHVHSLDTAPAYGDIEERLDDLCSGLSLRVISKIPPAPEAGAEASVSAAVERSRERLGARLTTLLFHSAEDLLRSDGERIWHAAIAAADGLRVGASCYDPATVVQLRQRYGLTLAQLPANPLDQRLRDSDSRNALDEVEIHARSSFLQGLLLMPHDEAVKKVPVAAKAHERWVRWYEGYGLSPVTAALAITRGLPSVQYCVVGVDSAAQFCDVLRSASETGMCIAPELRSDDPMVIDPRRWTAAQQR
jgi:aryl-alcohol dehydrogenase-like predicted oxidoreductase